MITQHKINASSFEDRTIIFPAVFAKAVNRFKEINLDQKNFDLVNEAISKKIEPSINNREENLWAQWKNLVKSSQKGE